MQNIQAVSEQWYAALYSMAKMVVLLLRLAQPRENMGIGKIGKEV